MEEQVVWFVLVVAFVFVIVLVLGEHAKNRQDIKDREEIANMECSDETKVKLYSTLLREQAERDL